MIQANMKMADLIHKDYHILPIINRFDIYPGFGDKTIEQICNEKNINTGFFLEVINVFLFENYFPQENLQSFDLNDILLFLKKTHDYFLNVKLHNIEEKINRLIKICCEKNSQKINLIKNFFIEYKTELIEHIKYEDEIIFPYVEQLANNKISTEQSNLNIQQYLDNHSNIEEKIYDLKNLIIKYLQLPTHTELSNEILFDLFDFEKDIQYHQKFEEKVLVPKVQKIENTLKH